MALSALHEPNSDFLTSLIFRVFQRYRSIAGQIISVFKTREITPLKVRPWTSPAKRELIEEINTAIGREAFAEAQTDELVFQHGTNQ